MKFASTKIYSRSPGLLAILGYCSLLLSGCASTSYTPPTNTTPPSAPTNLSATAASPTQIHLSWTASTDNVGVTGYKVERCQGAGCSNFVEIAISTGTTLNDTGLTASTSYSYRVRATDAAGNLSVYSAVVTSSTSALPDTTPPSAPTSLTATTASATQINLSWTASTDNVGVTGYKVERCQGAGCSNFAQIATPTGTALNDTGLTTASSYSYRVRATDAAGNLSAYSAVASALTAAGLDTTPPTAPTNLAATGASSSQINLTWTASTDNVGVTGYKVERCQGAGCSNFAQIAAPTGTTFSDTGLAASTSYSYRVRATDAAGNLSPYSAVATAVTSGTLDTTPPSVPTNVSATAASSSQINLTWTASTDNVGVTGYQVDRCQGAGCSNFVQIASPTGTTFNDTGLSGSTSYSYRVRAADAAGNVSGSSTAATATTLGSTVSVSISPKRGGLTVGQQLTLTATLVNDTQVVWSAANGGSLSGQTNTTTSFSAASAGVYTITATSVADPSRSASVTIGVTDLNGVLTYHNNVSRDGTNTKEYALTTANVATATFGKLFSCPVDGAIYAQPLWVANVTIGSAKHNLIIVATQHESVYAFDADANPCVSLWHASMIDTAHGGTAGETSVPSGHIGGLVGNGFGDIEPEVGITGTPVIDPSTNTLYVVSKSVIASITPPTFFQRLHALDLTTGGEKLNGNAPVVITASVPGNAPDSVGGTVTFNPQTQNQRPGLALVNGIVYISWASHEDADPYHGWFIGYRASDLFQIAALNTTPQRIGTAGVSRGGVWMSSGAPAADSRNNLYAITGNGTWDGVTNFGDSFLRISTASGLSLTDWFTPSNQASLNSNDTDLGSGGSVLVDLPSAPISQLVVGGGKEGTLYLLNRNSLGHFTSTDSGVVQKFPASREIFATPAYWQNKVYYAAVSDTLKMFTLDPTLGLFTPAAGPSATFHSSNFFGFPGSTPSISSNGSNNGIVWAIDSSAYGYPAGANGPAVLYAYDANNLTGLWNSSQTAGNAVKFTVPTVANGRVYIGTRSELDIYGLLP